jgi:hypothetical protein
VTPDWDAPKCVEHHIIADPWIIADAQMPWIDDCDGRSEDHILADVGTEGSKKKNSPPVHCLRRRPEQKPLDDPPELNKPSWLAPKTLWDGKHGEILVLSRSVRP